jgi:hypothetical protein
MSVVEIVDLFVVGALLLAIIFLSGMLFEACRKGQ